MLLYLRHAPQDRLKAGAGVARELVDNAIREGVGLRVRPKATTVAVVLAGLVPIVWGAGTGSEVMGRIAARMLGGQLAAVSRPHKMFSCPIPARRVGQLMAVKSQPVDGVERRVWGALLPATWTGRSAEVIVAIRIALACTRAYMRTGRHRQCSDQAAPPSQCRKAHQPIHQEAAGVAGMADDSGSFPCPGIAGFASFTLRLNEARLSN